MRLGRRVSARVLSLLALLVVLGTSIPCAAGAATKTTVTDYQYNLDGALTAITETVDDGAPTTRYLTWDNFVPDANDASTGTVAVGNGRLVGYGPSPGDANLQARFSFDPRDRLLSFTGTEASAVYDYHAGGMMAASSTDADTVHFYYDHNTNPRATNLYQESADLWSAYLDPVRYLSDGTEQALLTPRKDVACTYDPAEDSLQSYVYDAFGSSPDGVASSYDLRENPFRYTGEYRDPLWGGYYLRARWYHPDLPVFLSRDPAPNLNRYGYAGGNPAMNVDPSGLNFFHSLGSALRAVNSFLNKGIGGHFARIFLAPLMGPLQILANPKGFWDQIKTDKDGIDIFLVAGIATEGMSIGLEQFGMSAFVRNLSLATRFGTRLTVDGGLIVGQGVAAGANRGFHHFNWTSFGQNLELGGGGLAWGTLGAGVGYNAFTLKAEDVLNRVQNVDDDRVLIFRERTQGNTAKTFTSPAMEAAKIGHYHERIIAVSKDFSVSTELSIGRHGDEVFGVLKTSSKLNDKAAVVSFFSDKSRTGRYQFVGSVAAGDFSREAFRTANPRGLLAGAEYQDRLIDEKWGRAPSSAKFSRWTNNCHDHANAVLKEMGVR